MSVKPLKTIFYNNGRSFSVVVNDLLYEPVECIVNPSNPGLSHGAGLAAEIADAAGPAMEVECRRLVNSAGPLQAGYAAATTAGNLPFKGIVHVAGPCADDRTDSLERDLLVTLTAAFHVANLKRWRSLSFPAVSSGLFSVPLDICARTYVYAADSFLRSPEDRSLATIRLCLFQGPLVEKVLAEVEGLERQM